ncbi:50S ribosomal protein L22 [Candidatus Wolfebacteria bacterium]|nr:50S ribosomal protein L22 [Candidatus Wolfebacteria bacterium]
MKIQKAQLNYLKIAPRKVRLVAHSIKGLPVSEAEAQLLIRPQKSSEPVLKLLRSAVASAKNNQQLDSDKLFVKEIRVDKGPVMKRFMPRAMGRATLIQKKSSHIILTLAESDKPKEPRFKITVMKKISKAKAEKMAKAKLAAEEKKEKEPIKMKPEEQKRAAKKPGFMKKVFRRKSI